MSLKTQPYINGIVFDLDDPITSFHYYLSILKIIVEEYEMMKNIPGMNEVCASQIDMLTGITAKAKLLLDFLVQSPIEIVIKDQIVDKEILSDLLTSQGETHE